MPKLTIELDEQTLQRLQQRARRESCSVEEAAAKILRDAVWQERAALVERLRQLHQQLGQPVFSSSAGLIREDRERS